MKMDLTELLRKVGNEADIDEVENLNFPEDNLVLTQPVRVHLHLINTGNSVLLSGTIETEVEQECSRCLRTFKMPLIAKMEEEFSKSPPLAKEKKEVELKEEDFIYPIEKDNSLDLDEVIRQNLLLALPIKPLCKLACKGE